MRNFRSKGGKGQDRLKTKFSAEHSILVLDLHKSRHYEPARRISRMARPRSRGLEA